jgi:hypothetical protein
MLLAVLEQASQPPASEFTTFSSTTNASVVYTFFTLFNAALNSPF